MTAYYSKMYVKIVLIITLISVVTLIHEGNDLSVLYNSAVARVQLAIGLLASSQKKGPPCAVTVIKSLPKKSLLPPVDPSAIPQPQHQPQHPAFSRTCYHYFTDLSTENWCHKAVNFSQRPTAVRSCVSRAHLATNRTVSWAIMGDSHMRYIFTAFLTRLLSPTLQYRLPPKEKGWQSAVPLEETLHNNKMMQNIEVRDASVNLSLKFYWDPKLQQMPSLLHYWEVFPHEAPDLLVFDSGYWFMLASGKVFHQRGARAAMEPFVNKMRNMAPALARLARNATVVFKLIDDVRRGYKVKATNPINMVSNYILYNEAAIRELNGTGVVVWDSCLPLSFGYNAACRTNPKTTPPRYYWKCVDPDHVGYILVEQYADMIINDFCCQYLDSRV